MRVIDYLANIIDSINWISDRSKAVRMVNVFRVLLGAMYGTTIEDEDRDPNDKVEKSITTTQEKQSLELAIAARQQKENQLQSYNDLAATLAESNRKLNERMKEEQNG